MEDIAAPIYPNARAEAEAILAKIQLLADKFQARLADSERLTEENKRIASSVDARLDSL